MEKESVSPVFQCIEIVVCHLPETVCVSVDVGIMCKELRVHKICCFFFENPDLSVSTLLKMGDHESGHVNAGCAQGACRSHSMDKFKLFCFKNSFFIFVPHGHKISQVGGERLAECAVCHSQRFKNIFFNIGFKG